MIVSMIDWQAVTNNLRHHYKPLAQVAKEIGAGEKHLQNLARGDTVMTSFDVGIRLLDLHHDHCPEQHRKLRMTRT